MAALREPMNRRLWVRVLLGFLIAAIVAALLWWGKVDVQLEPVPFSGPSHERDSIVAYEARRAGMDPMLAIAISHVENWSGDSTAMHPRTKATGIMQVMPFWSDSFQVECYGPASLTMRSRNACLGARIAVRYFNECGNWNCALRWYVGARCLATDGPERCLRKQKVGLEYVLEVVERFGRNDLSPSRDAMALGNYRYVAVPQ